jgi:nucleotide-binding universal stress UspA family protein
VYRSVIVPLDYSAADEHVLPMAVQIARGSDAILRLLYIPKPEAARTLEGGTSVDLALLAPRMRPQAYLDQTRQRLGSGSDLKITADVLQGSNGHASASPPDVTDMDLIVLANHRQNGSVRFRLADITDALVYWRPAPMLVLRTDSGVPDAQPPPRLQRMLLPLDGSALAEQILVPAVALGRVMETEYTLLHLVEPYSFVSGEPVPYTSRLSDLTIAHMQAEAQDYLDGIALLMRAEGLQVQTRVMVACDARIAIRQVAREHEIDLIAMTTHARGGLNRLLLGSVAVQMLRDNHLPVLFYRPQERRGPPDTGNPLQ